MLDKDVAFIGVERYDDHYELARKCYVNKIPGITAIGDKKAMARIMSLNEKYNDMEIGFMPESYHWPEE